MAGSSVNHNHGGAGVRGIHVDARSKAGKQEHDLAAKLRRMPGLLTPREAARLMHKHPETLYRMIASKRIAAIRDGSRWKIDPNEVAKWIEQRSI